MSGDSAQQGRVLRFLLVGLLNSLFGFAVFSGLSLAGSSNWLSVLGSNMAGLAFNYFTHSALVFRDLSLAKLPRFGAFYTMLVVLNTALLGWLGPKAGGPVMAQALLTPPLAVLSYVALSRWVFRRKAAP
ncbi:MAG TPA: GtrA family protein [Ramlibacter sp.]|nr:GtrA family protein [Ramlibacter sp.]